MVVLSVVLMEGGEGRGEGRGEERRGEESTHYFTEFTLQNILYKIQTQDIKCQIENRYQTEYSPALCSPCSRIQTTYQSFPPPLLYLILCEVTEWSGGE